MTPEQSNMLCEFQSHVDDLCKNAEMLSESERADCLINIGFAAAHLDQLTENQPNASDIRKEVDSLCNDAEAACERASERDRIDLVNKVRLAASKQKI